MDPAMQAHLAAQGGGGEGGEGGRTFLGLSDINYLSGSFNGAFQYGLEHIFRRIFTVFHDGKIPFDIGKRDGKLSKLIKKILQEISEGFSNEKSGGGGGHSMVQDHSPAASASHGLSGGGGGSGISYDH